MNNNKDNKMTLDEAINHSEEMADETPCGQEHRQLADWLKELRELRNRLNVGNAKAMRDVLLWLYLRRDFLDFCHNGLADKTWEDWDKVYYFLRELIDKTMKALSCHPRNCDVGTAKEQYERFRKFCYHYHMPGGGCYNRIDDRDCPLRYKDGACTINWEQLNYITNEESGM